MVHFEWSNSLIWSHQYLFLWLFHSRSGSSLTSLSRHTRIIKLAFSLHCLKQKVIFCFWVIIKRFSFSTRSLIEMQHPILIKPETTWLGSISNHNQIVTFPIYITMMIRLAIHELLVIRLVNGVTRSIRLVKFGIGFILFIKYFKLPGDCFSLCVTSKVTINHSLWSFAILLLHRLISWWR